MPTYSEVQAKILANLGTGSQITALKHQEVENDLLLFAKEIAESQWVTGDLKMIDCTNDYIELHFITQGLSWGMGKVGGEREGWAICNGNNLTMNRTGRVPMGWGTNNAFDSRGVNIKQPNMKTAVGGSVDYGANSHTLTVQEMPTHVHGIPTHGASGDGFAGTNYSGYTQAIPGAIPNQLYVQLTDRPPTTPKPNNTYNTQQTGSSIAHNIVQPSMVTLFIQKL